MVIIASVTVVTMIVAVVVMTAVLSVHVMRVIVMVIRRRHGGADCDRAVKRPQGHDESTPLHPQQSHSDQNDKRIAHDFDGIDRAPDGRRSRIQQRGGRCPPEPPRPGPETAREANDSTTPRDHRQLAGIYYHSLVCMRGPAARRAYTGAILTKNHMADAAASAAPKMNNR